MSPLRHGSCLSTAPQPWGTAPLSPNCAASRYDPLPVRPKPHTRAERQWRAACCSTGNALQRQAERDQTQAARAASSSQGRQFIQAAAHGGGHGAHRTLCALPASGTSSRRQLPMGLGPELAAGCSVTLPPELHDRACRSCMAGGRARAAAEAVAPGPPLRGLAHLPPPLLRRLLGCQKIATSWPLEQAFGRVPSAPLCQMQLGQQGRRRRGSSGNSAGCFSVCGTGASGRHPAALALGALRMTVCGPML